MRQMRSIEPSRLSSKPRWRSALKRRSRSAGSTPAGKLSSVVTKNSMSRPTPLTAPRRTLRVPYESGKAAVLLDSASPQRAAHDRYGDDHECHGLDVLFARRTDC